MNTPNHYRKRERICIMLILVIIVIAFKLPDLIHQPDRSPQSFNSLQIEKLDSIVVQLKAEKIKRKLAFEKEKDEKWKKYNAAKKYKTTKSSTSRKRNKPKGYYPKVKAYSKDERYPENKSATPRINGDSTFLEKSQVPIARQPYNYSLDLNSTNQMELESLKGIGPTLAKRILKFRDGLGGFHSVSQIKATYGLPPETFELIKNQLVIEKPLAQIDVNTITEKELSVHTLVNYKQAKWIVAYREQHGPYSQLKDLLKIRMLDPKQIEDWRPYFSFITQSDSTNEFKEISVVENVGQ